MRGWKPTVAVNKPTMLRLTRSRAYVDSVDGFWSGLGPQPKTAGETGADRNYIPLRSIASPHPVGVSAVTPTKPSDRLTAKQEKFVAEMLSGKTQVDAYRVTAQPTPSPVSD